MSMRPLTLMLPVALAFGLVACDSRDYEGEITGLQGQLEEAQAELETQRAENQTLTGEVEELRAQAGPTAAGGEVSDQVRAQLETAMEKATQTAERLAALERDPDAPAETRSEAVGLLRTDVQEIAAAVDAAATELGIELQQAAATEGGGEPQQPEPAAGPEGEQEPRAE
jgi:multidrug resistance efflux pump